MSASQQITALQDTIQGLLVNLQSGRLPRPALMAGARVLAGGIRAEAPVGRSAKVHRQNRKRAVAGGKAGLPRLKDSIGSRVKLTGRKTQIGSKVGPSVGMKKKKRAPQGGWNQTGTKKRYRKDGSYAGQITRINNFTERGVAATEGRAVSVIVERLSGDIQRGLK